MTFAKAPKTRNRVFTLALVVSALFHLSMVSVFSIVIWFPRSDIHYYPVSIVRESALGDFDTASLPETRGTLRRPDPGHPLGQDSLFDALEPDMAERWHDTLPAIQLPRLEFAGLDRVRNLEEGLRIRSEFTQTLGPSSDDSWARFSQELRDLGGLVSRLTEPEDEPVQAGPQWVSTPAPGFAAYIDWISEPQDRDLLFSPKIRALWGVDPEKIAEPIMVVFAVNSQGKVTEVQIPVEDDAGLVAGVGSALLKYRFEPIHGEEGADQRGTFIILPGSGGGLAEFGQ